LVPLNVTPHSIRINLYDSYLLNEIGLSLSTRRTRRRHIEEFLTWLLPCHAKSLEVLSSKHLNSYMSSISKTKSPLTTAVAVTSLKCFLAFSSAKGDCPPNLCHGILRPKMIHSISTTNSLTEGELNRLIGAFDCSRDLGRRDYAMARCLIDLGLRTDDVAHISLNHINWHNGTITLAPGKSNCGRIVPLPPTTAKALLDYLQYGRPVTKEQYVFVYHCAPVGKAVLSSTIRQALRRAFKRAGFADSESQVHRIRHTMATRLLDQNIPIKIIADVLGHACIETTTRYTHISRSMLSDVAMDWQGGGIEL
jgi:integrase/recombinase XerD